MLISDDFSRNANDEVLIVVFRFLQFNILFRFLILEHSIGPHAHIDVPNIGFYK